MRKIVSLLLLLVITVVVNSAMAEIYRWVDESGKIHFTDSPPEKVKSKTIKLQINSFSSSKVSPFKYDPGLISKRKASADVVMYSTEWCGYCKKARKYFNQQKIPFEEYDVEKSEKGKRDYKALNGKGVPLILVGARRMSGFSVDTFEGLYRR